MPSALPLPREQKTANISLDFNSSSKKNFNSNSMICSGSGSTWLLPNHHKQQQQTKTNKNSASTTLNNNEFISNSFYNSSNSSWLFPATANKKMSRLPSINNSEFILIRTQPNQIKINKDSATSLINSSKKISMINFFLY
jgi:hypothetical protein